jgi:hypothetical protein
MASLRLKIKRTVRWGKWGHDDVMTPSTKIFDQPLANHFSPVMKSFQDVLEMVLQLVPRHPDLAAFLQPFFVAPRPVSFDVLQPARTFSSGVPLPRTINWGCIHFFRLSFMSPPIAFMASFSLRMLYDYYIRSF